MALCGFIPQLRIMGAVTDYRELPRPKLIKAEGKVAGQCIATSLQPFYLYGDYMILIGYITYQKKLEINLKQDLILQSNAINIFDLYCVDEDDIAVDITGATVILIVKVNPTDTDATAVINKEITDLTNPNSGNTLITIEKEDCEDLVGNYVYELRVSMAESGYEYILKQGNLTFQKSIYGIE